MAFSPLSSPDSPSPSTPLSPPLPLNLSAPTSFLSLFRSLFSRHITTQPLDSPQVNLSSSTSSYPPCSIVWAPHPYWGWFCPFLGVFGVVDSAGTIFFFHSSYFVAENVFETYIGSPMRFFSYKGISKQLASEKPSISRSFDYCPQTSLRRRSCESFQSCVKAEDTSPSSPLAVKMPLASDTSTDLPTSYSTSPSHDASASIQRQTATSAALGTPMTLENDSCTTPNNLDSPSHFSVGASQENEKGHRSVNGLPLAKSTADNNSPMPSFSYPSIYHSLDPSSPMSKKIISPTFSRRQSCSPLYSHSRQENLIFPLEVERKGMKSPDRETEGGASISQSDHENMLWDQAIYRMASVYRETCVYGYFLRDNISFVVSVLDELERISPGEGWRGVVIIYWWLIAYGRFTSWKMLFRFFLPFSLYFIAFIWIWFTLIHTSLVKVFFMTKHTSGLDFTQ